MVQLYPNHRYSQVFYVIYEAVIIPSFGKVGPVGNHVARDIPVSWPVSQGGGKWLSEDILKVISMVGSHPAGVRLGNTTQTIGLWEHVWVGASCSERKRQAKHCYNPEKPLNWTINVPADVGEKKWNKNTKWNNSKLILNRKGRFLTWHGQHEGKGQPE